jgi:flagellar protein FliO/FliZ
MNHLSSSSFSQLGIWVTETAPGGRFAAPTEFTANPALSGGSSFLQILLSLLLVIGTIFLVGWAIRRIKTMPKGRRGLVRVVDEVGLGAKERAVVIEVDGVRLVVGVGDGRVTLLHRYAALADKGQVQDADVDAPNDATSLAFIDVLKKSLGR